MRHSNKVEACHTLLSCLTCLVGISLFVLGIVEAAGYSMLAPTDSSVGLIFGGFFGGACVMATALASGIEHNGDQSSCCYALYNSLARLCCCEVQCFKDWQQPMTMAENINPIAGIARNPGLAQNEQVGEMVESQIPRMQIIVTDNVAQQQQFHPLFNQNMPQKQQENDMLEGHPMPGLQVSVVRASQPIKFFPHLSHEKQTVISKQVPPPPECICSMTKRGASI